MLRIVHDVVPVPVSFPSSAAASSVFLPRFIFELNLAANTPRRHTTRTRNITDTAGKTTIKSLIVCGGVNEIDVIWLDLIFVASEIVRFVHFTVLIIKLLRF